MGKGTGQSPKVRGFALERTETMVWRGLLALVRERDAKQAEINEVGGELNRIIEERLDRDDVLLTGDGVTHRIDPETMQVRPLTDQERMQLGIFRPEPEPEAKSEESGLSPGDPEQGLDQQSEQATAARPKVVAKRR